MRRRQLLAGGLAAAPGLVLGGRLYAAPAAPARLLVVFLRGAYDAAGVVAPVSSDFYHASRPTLALARPDPANPDAALPLADGYGLHPALRDTVLPLWSSGQVAFVPFAGTDDLTRSHFETQDAIERGAGAAAGGGDYGSGFLGRLVGQLSGPRPIAFTDQLPLILRGGPTLTPNMSVNVGGKPGLDEREARLIADMYRRTPYAASVAEGFQVRDEVYRSVSAEMTAASRGAASPKGFELSAWRIARLMRADFDLGFVDVGGWDTHVNQGGAQGYLAGRLGELGRGLSAFADELGPQEWRRTFVVVISEFGRTFRENGDRGTDHGHGSVYWVLSGGLTGPRIAGRQVALSPATLNQNRDYPVLNEYRSLFAGLFQELYGLTPRRLEAVFPGVSPVRLGLA